MTHKLIGVLLLSTVIFLLPLMDSAIAEPVENNPNLIAFDGNWCRVKVIVQGDSKRPGDRYLVKNQEALWEVSAGNNLVDGFYYAWDVHYNLSVTTHNDPEDPLYCYGNGADGLVQGNFTLIPYAFMPDGAPPDTPPDVEGSWQGSWQGKYSQDEDGYPYWRLQGQGHGTGSLEGLKIKFGGENLRIFTMNCENNIRSGCEGIVEWVPWEFKGYILDPGGKVLD